MATNYHLTTVHLIGAIVTLDDAVASRRCLNAEAVAAAPLMRRARD